MQEQALLNRGGQLPTIDATNRQIETMLPSGEKQTVFASGQPILGLGEDQSARLRDEAAILSSAGGERRFDKEVMPVATRSNQAMVDAKSLQEGVDGEPVTPEILPREVADELSGSKTPEQLAAEQRLAQLDTQKENISKAYDDLSLAYTDQAKVQLATLKQQWEQRRALLEKSNLAQLGTWRQQFLRTGAAEYSPGMVADFVSDKEKEGIRALSELDSQYNNAIGQINTALQTNNYKLAAEKAGEIAEIEDKAYELMQKNLKETQQVNADLADEENIAKLFTAGITDPIKIFSALSKAKAPVSAEKIKKFLDSVQTKESTSTKNDFTFKFAGGDVGAMLASGKFLGMEDIQAVQDAFNEFGWRGVTQITDVDQQKFLRSILLPKDKAAQNTGETGIGDFDQFSREQIALSVVPVQLRNTEVELNRFLQGIRSGLATGLTPYQVADTLMGYRIDDPNDFTDGFRQYLAILPDLTSVQEVARLINANNYQGAIAKLETQALQEQKKTDPEGYMGEAATRYSVEKVNEINKLLESEKFFDRIGPFEGTLNGALGSRFGFAAAARIRAKLKSLTAQLRNDISGATVTKEEKAFLEPLIPELSDNLGVFKEKLKELKGNPLTKYNTVRSTIGLPKVTEAELLDRNQRVNAYTKIPTYDPLEISVQSDPNNSAGI